MEWTLQIPDELAAEVDALRESLRPGMSRDALVQYWIECAIREARRDGVIGTSKIERALSCVPR